VIDGTDRDRSNSGAPRPGPRSTRPVPSPRVRPGRARANGLLPIGLASVAAFVLALSVACLGPSSDFGVEDSVLRWASGRAEVISLLGKDVARLLPNARAVAAIAVVEDGEASVAMVGAGGSSPTTLFELGSVTKVATANLVVQRVLAGALDLDTGLDRLPGGEPLGSQWSQVTLRDLLTHSAGLSGWPPNWGPVRIVLTGSLGDPFASYDGEDLLEGMRRNGALRVGEGWRYSNYGFAILGRVLEQESGSAYAPLLHDRFLSPLAMETATVGGWSGEDVARPLGRRGGRATNWDFDAFAPAGALRGSAQDAVAFLRHAMEACRRDDVVSKATCFAQRPAGFRMNEESEMGLGWVRTARDGVTIVWHNGGTGGYSTFLGFSPERDRGVVILTNVGFLREIDDLAMEAILAPGDRHAGRGGR